MLLMRNWARTELFREQADICLGLSILCDMELVWLVCWRLGELPPCSCFQTIKLLQHCQATAQSSLAQHHIDTAVGHSHIGTAIGYRSGCSYRYRSKGIAIGIDLRV